MTTMRRFWWHETVTGGGTDFILYRCSKKEILASLTPVIASDAVLCTDGSSAMASAAAHLGIEHMPWSGRLASVCAALGTFRTSMPITHASRTGFVAFEALPPAISTISSDGFEPLTDMPLSTSIPPILLTWHSADSSIPR